MLPPSSCTPAHQLNVRKWRKVLDFLATTENISVISILLLLNPKPSSYWEDSVCQLYPSTTRTVQENMEML